ncbi:MAG: hypothetical protein EA412_07365 [Chitinophagaceae bacterium]|nr:MAG: hypothetical protein EA412_07365 [Chitinophagaceae bacterium]
MEIKKSIPLKLVFTLLSALFLFSCEFLQPRPEPEEGKVLARVENDFLYLRDLDYVLHSSHNIADSNSLIESYTNNWIRNKLAFRAARRNLPDRIPEIEKQVNEYRASLYIHLYESELIKQNLDTQLVHNDLKDYYAENSANFILKEDIVSFQFLKLDVATPNQEQAIEWLQGGDDNSRQLLNEYALQYAMEYSLEESFWIPLSKGKRVLPISDEDYKSLATSNRAEKLEENGQIFLVKVNDFKSIGDLAPFEYVKSDIRKIIINLRKRNLINSTYNKLYNEALRERVFELYD